MWFAVATVAYWKSIGFDTTHWRKSLTNEGDDKIALVHDKFASTLVEDTSTNEHIQVYDVDSDEFKTLIKEHFEPPMEEDPMYIEDDPMQEDPTLIEEDPVEDPTGDTGEQI